MRTLAKGELLFRQGDLVRDIYEVVAGRIRMCCQSADGHEVLLLTARRGDLIFASALFRDTHHCNAQAAEPASVRIYDKKALLAALDADASRALPLVRGLAEDIGRMRARLELRAIRLARQRLLHYLEAQAEPGGRTVTFDGPMTELALEVDLSRETLHRALARLEKDRLIERTSDSVRLLRPP